MKWKTVIIMCMMAIIARLAAANVVAGAKERERMGSVSLDAMRIIRVTGKVYITLPTRRVMIVTRRDRFYPEIQFGSYVAVKKGGAELGFGKDVRIKMKRAQNIFLSRNPHDGSIYIGTSPKSRGNACVTCGSSTVELYPGSTITLDSNRLGEGRVRAFQGRVRIEVDNRDGAELKSSRPFKPYGQGTGQTEIPPAPAARAGFIDNR